MKMKVIIIDDDPLVVESLKTILGVEKIEIPAVGYNGTQAVEQYKIHKPDIVLMDIRMKNMSGMEAAQKYWR